jgi:hypothetical protein
MKEVDTPASAWVKFRTELFPSGSSPNPIRISLVGSVTCPANIILLVFITEIMEEYFMYGKNNDENNDDHVNGGDVGGGCGLGGDICGETAAAVAVATVEVEVLVT